MIPIVDFEHFVGGNATERDAVAAQVYAACHRVGFLYARGLGLPPEAIARTFAQARGFFALPMAAKSAVAWEGAASNRGYVGLGRERLDPDRPGDWKEAFNIAAETPASPGARWPDAPPLFRETCLEFFCTCARAADILHEAFALALQLPERFFIERHDRQDYTLRLLHYPPLVGVPAPGQLRAGEHSDYGSLTLLFQDAAGGLEIQTAGGEWIAAPPIAETVVVNTGDLMQRWTNHVFASTRHRVRLPNDAEVWAREAIAFFCHPNLDSEIACLDTCCGPERPPLYPPIRSRDYLLSRLRATY